MLSCIGVLHVDRYSSDSSLLQNELIYNPIHSSQVNQTLYLVTERCVPLSVYMRDAQLTAEQRESCVAWGFYQVMVSEQVIFDL